AAAAPVRHPAPRRACQATAASWNGPVPGGRRRVRRLLGSKPILPSLQAPRRRHAGAVPAARENRLKELVQLCWAAPPVPANQADAGISQRIPNSPQIPPRNRTATPLPFLMSRVGRRGRAAGAGQLSAPALLRRRDASRIGLLPAD